MKIAVVTSGLIPYPGFQGSTYAMWSLITALKDFGHEIHFILLKRGTKYDKDESQFEPMLNIGVKVTTVRPEPMKFIVKKWHKLFPFSLYSAYNEVQFTTPLNREIKKLEPDRLIFYTARSLAAFYKSKLNVKTVTSTVDLDHIARWERLKINFKTNFKLRNVAGFLQYLNYVVAVRYYHVKLLRKSNLVISHAHHHSKWLLKKGANVKYVPLPVSDTGKDTYQNVIKKEITEQRPVVYGLLGTAAGIATLLGIDFSDKNIFPQATTENLNCEFRIFGNQDKMPKLYKDKISRFKNVIIRGYIENISDIFLEIDCLFVPTPSNLGFRTRIAEAFSFGCLVLAHPENLLGMPELKSNHNVLTAANFNDFKMTHQQILDEPQKIKEIKMAARETFESKYHPQVSCKKFSEYVENL